MHVVTWTTKYTGADILHFGKNKLINKKNRKPIDKFTKKAETATLYTMTMLIGDIWY